MARREVTQIFDDLDNKPLDEAEVRVIRFAVNGTDYVLDVSEKNANRFYEVIGPYVEAARKVPSIRTHKGGAVAAYDPKQVREWATRNGYAVARRGKISQEIIDAYLAVNS
ncbi:Lsr2 family protein [Corynebacterium sp. SCR221107]|uniref:histone-like nucleoid-structuring protein Lsr2 n=1 Tax=Corynebacterium sp. SCR221107 TaxID=3017361 RepID=UPI0022EC5EAF|nr:Lsr2 family protein [Corynebacterium sp. SCR221107]WBT08647.1 Lsr2 family protein [Corynebacterium sp. SCR221107]